MNGLQKMFDIPLLDKFTELPNLSPSLVSPNFSLPNISQSLPLY